MYFIRLYVIWPNLHFSCHHISREKAVKPLDPNFQQDIQVDQLQ